MRSTLVSLAAFALLAALPAWAQTSTISPDRIDAVIKSAFPNAPEDFKSRLLPDATMKDCTAHANNPPPAIAEAIQKSEAATIQYPPDGKFLGDWRKGEALAQSGYGLRFSDYPPTRANGGNCYACHQLTRQELSYGTVGPSLLEYGKLRDFKAEDAKTVYEKIYDPHVALACSLMPRFGSNKVLTIDQIKDIVALLMSSDSPVNK